MRITSMRIPRNMFMLLMGIWFILWGLFPLVPALAFSGHNTVMAVMAVVVGLLCLFER